MYNKIVIHPLPSKKPRDWTQNPGWHLRWKARGWDREANRHYATGSIIPAIKWILVFIMLQDLHAVSIFLSNILSLYIGFKPLRSQQKGF